MPNPHLNVPPSLPSLEENSTQQDLLNLIFANDNPLPSGNPGTATEEVIETGMAVEQAPSHKRPLETEESSLPEAKETKTSDELIIDFLSCALTNAEARNQSLEEENKQLKDNLNKQDVIITSLAMRAMVLRNTLQSIRDKSRQHTTPLPTHGRITQAEAARLLQNRIDLLADLTNIEHLAQQHLPTRTPSETIGVFFRPAPGTVPATTTTTTTAQPPVFNPSSQGGR